MSQKINLQEELRLFRSFVNNENAFVHVENIGPDIYRLSPKTDIQSELTIGLMALTHGNETIGLPILTSLLSAILSGSIQIFGHVYVALGNVEAALIDKRFVEKDLNRCFGLSSQDSIEDRRAKQLEELFLDKVDYLLDLHQTVYASETPFFIFRYSSANCFKHLSLMNRDLPTVLQFDNIGEDQGLSTDEYVRSRGHFGTALELGQVGFIERFFREGLECCLRLIESSKFQKRFLAAGILKKPELNCKIYGISGRYYAPEDNSTLESKFFNFSDFKAGEIIGRTPLRELRTEKSGKMLFPKVNQALTRGQNLFFICNELSNEKLNELSSNESEKLLQHSLQPIERSL